MERADPDRRDARTYSGPHDRAWVIDAIACIEADLRRSADTHLVTFPLPAAWGIDLYLKDESTHPTGSLKHRLARSLFLYGLCNGWIGEGVTIIEASSGSTAVSEAYFARMLDLPFVAVVPATISPEKVALIEQCGGRCHVVDDPSSIYSEAARLAADCGGVFLDQFTHAERATDWRGNNNIAESIFEQMALERHPVPAWVVVGAGTGGTAATIGRYIRYLPGRDQALRRRPTEQCVRRLLRVGQPAPDLRRTLPGSKGSDASEWSRVSSARSSTAWSASTTRRPSRRCDLPPIASGGRSAGRPAPICAARSD